MSSITDTRFLTANTSLAACLGALRVPIKIKQPVTVVISADDPGKRQTTFHFETQGEEFLGESYQCAQIDWAWRNRSRFEQDNPGHPLVFMRRGLESFEWCNKVWHGAIPAPQDQGVSECRIDDIGLASVYRAMGERVLRFHGRAFYFRRQVQALDRDYARFRDPEFLAAPAALIRRVLTVRAELVALTKHPDLVPMVRYTTGGDPESGCAIADVPVNASADVVEQTLQILHSL